MQDI
jgi:hypothetical protein